MAAQIESGIGIDPDLDGLALAHVGELAFLEIPGDPDLGSHQREDLLAGGQIIADLDIALGDPAILRRLDRRPRQVEVGLIQPRLRLLDLALGLKSERPASPIDTVLDAAVITDRAFRDPTLVAKLDAVCGRYFRAQSGRDPADA